METFFDHCMIFIDDLLGAYIFFQCPDRYGHAMLIAAANKFYVSLSGPLVAHIYICRYIHAGQVADMHGSIRIR